MKKASFPVMPAVCLILAMVSPALGKLRLDLETGAVFSGYNDVRIPGDGGTRFSLSEELSADPGAFYRIRLFVDLSERHHLGVLYAPLSIRSTGSLDRNLVFQEATFSANSALETTYQFNSYRVIYRYDLVRRDRVELGLGFTAKIRDAKIAVKGDGQEAEKTNVGFVPIVHFHLLWRFTGRFAFLLDGDALAAPQGRAEDIFTGLILRMTDRAALKLGYRFVEGGADNDEVYNFAWIHYASLGAIFTF